LVGAAPSERAAHEHVANERVANEHVAGGPAGPGLRIAVGLLSPESYPELLEVFGAISEQAGGRLYLLTNHRVPALEAALRRWPRLRAVVLGRGRVYRARAAAWLDAQLAGPGLDLVHDNFGHLVAWFQQAAADRARTVRLITTQYTTNQGWFARVRRAGPDFDAAYARLRVQTLWRDRRICWAADHVIVLGPGHETDLAEGHGLPAERVSWVPAEIDTAIFRPEPESKFESSPTLESGPTLESEPKASADHGMGPRLLFTGSVFRNKGVDVLLDMVTLLRGRHPNLTLALVGPVPDFEARWLREAVAARGLGDAVLLTGRVDRSVCVSVLF
jgi:glycosyltransferase involved in cell wall biosynthesis